MDSGWPLQHNTIISHYAQPRVHVCTQCVCACVRACVLQFESLSCTKSTYTHARIYTCVHTHADTHAHTHTHKNAICLKAVTTSWQVVVITWPRGRWLIYHMRAEAPEGVKLAKRTRAHVIPGLLQFKLLCWIMPKWMRPTFLWISTNAFLFGKKQAKCISVRHQKRSVCEQRCFPERAQTENCYLQHGLGAEVHLA